MLNSHFDHLSEIIFAMATTSECSGVNSVFRQRLGALGVLAQQAMSVEMKIAHQRRRKTHTIELFADSRNGFSSFWCINRYTYELGTRLRQLAHLDSCCNRIGRIGVSH